MQQSDNPLIRTTTVRALALKQNYKHVFTYTAISGAIALVALAIALGSAHDKDPLAANILDGVATNTELMSLRVPTAHAAARVDIDEIRERSQERVEEIKERLEDHRPTLVPTAHAEEADEEDSDDASEPKEKDDKKKESEPKKERKENDSAKKNNDEKKESAPAATRDENKSDNKAEKDKPQTMSSDSFGLSGKTAVEESGSMSGGNGDWWVSSGAYFYVNNGIGSTVQGKLDAGNEWRERYSSSNPTDTDNGYLPQNIFRLVAKAQFEDVTQEAYFRINKINMTGSPNRAGHNGFLFFNRYHDQDNLYYTGIRVDGTAIIKKKKGGSYTTLASDRVFSGSYNKSSNPNLIPENKWIGLRSVVKDVSGGVNIKVYMDTGDGWKLVAEATDTSNTITGKSHVGVRTDFMDAEFKNYHVREN